MMSRSTTLVATNGSDATASTSTLAVAAAAGTAIVTVSLTLLFAAAKRRHEKWHSSDEQRKRLEVQKAASLLVGPNPTLVATTTDGDNNSDSDSGSGSVRFLTSHYHYPSPGVNDTPEAKDSAITAVIIHGFGCTSLEFQDLMTLLLVEKELPVKIDHFFLYDRVLFVPQDDVATLCARPRDAFTCAAELHQLLSSKNITNNTSTTTTKYLLIGHSYGGLIAQHFAHLYPDCVAGMVLIDPAHELQNTQFPRDFAGSMTTVVPPVLRFYERLAWTGLVAILDRYNLFNFPPLFLVARKNVRQACVQLYSEASAWKIAAAELQGCMETFDQINNNANNNNNKANNNAPNNNTPKRQDNIVFDRQQFYQLIQDHDIPIALVIASQRKFTPTLWPDAVTRAFVNMHETMPNTTRLMASQADHWVHLQQPEIVCQAVQSVLERIGSKNK